MASSSLDGIKLYKFVTLKSKTLVDSVPRHSDVKLASGCDQVSEDLSYEITGK